MKKEFYKNNTIDNFELSYYLLDGENTYGIEVEKKYNDTVEESKAIYDICEQKNEVFEFLNKICDGNVTPTTLYDVVVDWIDER